METEKQFSERAEKLLARITTLLTKHGLEDRTSLIRDLSYDYLEVETEGWNRGFKQSSEAALKAFGSSATAS